jgi:LysR family transcriptional regulator, cys regulon transcriptional activator
MLTLQQLRTACAVTEAGFNLSRAAEILHTTQPAVSKTIKAIELDLGAAVFVRSTTRITGLTAFGENLTELAQNILRDSAAVIDLARESNKVERGVLTIGATHRCALYMLPHIARLFADRYPEVVLAIEHADPRTIPEWVASGKVTIGITPILQQPSANLVALAARDSGHCIIAPRGHAVLAENPPSLAEVARYPLVTYASNLSATSDLQAILLAHGHIPRVAVIARDASVVKAHVGCGVGIGVIQTIAFDEYDAQRFGRVDAAHLLPPASFHVLFRRDQYFRSYIYDFIELFSPQWTRDKIRDRLAASSRVRVESTAVSQTQS